MAGKQDLATSDPQAEAPVRVEPGEIGAGRRVFRLAQLAGRFRGARMCYGRPVEAGERTVIPVASVFVAGGFGFGDRSEPGADGGASGGDNASGGGGGGGGTVTATPIGFIEISPEGTRFRRIVDPSTMVRTLGALAAPLIAAAVARRRRSDR